MPEMTIRKTIKLPCKSLFEYEFSNRPGYITKMVTVKAPYYGLKVDVYEPTFLEKIFNISIDKKVGKAKMLILKEIEKDKRWNDLCLMLKNS